VQIWLAFLILSFVVGGWSARSGRSGRFVPAILAAVVVAFMLSRLRWV
jgi:hypothetical protein